MFGPRLGDAQALLLAADLFVVDSQWLRRSPLYCMARARAVVLYGLEFKLEVVLLFFKVVGARWRLPVVDQLM